MRYVLDAFRWALRTTWFLVFAAMLALNVATLTVSGIATAANGALAAVGVTTFAARSATAAATSAASASAARKAAVKRVTGRVSRRVARSAARSVGAVAGESLPYVGVAVVLGVTAAELKDACDTMQDLQELDEAFGDGDGTVDAEASRVCGYQTPTLEEVKARVTEAPGQAWESAKNLPDVALPDVSADWERYDAAVRDWLVSIRSWFGGMFAD